MNKTLGWIALISALFISSIAIYFSVAGLAAIFSAAALSVIIMGTSIEVGKLVAVVWLHYNWKDAAWLKTGLSVFVVGVMFITSMGIFGYLSKSHVEQTAQTGENVAQVQRIETEIARHEAILVRSTQKIKGYEENGSGVDASLNAQIDKEQTRIDTAYERVKPVIQGQLDIIATAEEKVQQRTTPYQTELDAITQQLADLQAALSNKEIRTAQGIVGTQPDGSYKEKTQAAIRDFRTRNEARRDVLLQKIDTISGTPSAASKSAQEEISRIRASVQSEIDESNATINKLRSRMGKTNANDIETLITSERTKIKDSNTELDTLTEEKYTLESSYRKLEAEVGPIKYIAEFVYDRDPDANLLERAVTWLIILIIFVFDPFAVFLLIAAQHSFDKYRRGLSINDELDKIDDTVDQLNDVIKETEQMVENALEVEHEIEELIKESEIDPEPETNHEWDKTFQLPTHEDYFPDEEEIEPEPVMPENETVPEHEITDRYDHADDALYLMDEERPDETIEAPEFDITTESFEPTVIAPQPGFITNEIKSGTEFPGPASNQNAGMLFLRTDETPTQLYHSSGTEWIKKEKDMLGYSAYSHEYIKALIKRLGNGDYNPTLLKEAEKKHIEELLGRE